MTAPSLLLPLPEIVDGAVGPFGPYCMGYMNPGASGYGYVNAMKLSVGKVNVQGLDPGTESIVAYDRCEKNDAYIGQINMLTASSFCGINGALWGYHLAQADAIAAGTLQPLFTYPGPHDPAGDKLPRQSTVPVYPVAPLLDAAERLFGRMERQPGGHVDRRRFPPLPGAHVVCANKSAGGRGPCYVWSAIAVAIAANRDSTASLFIEDANVADSREAMETLLEQSLRAVAKSMILCGQEQNIVFSRIYAGAKYLYVGPDEWGCALACAPYLLLARDAIPPGQPARSLIGLNLSQWENALQLAPLPPPLPESQAGGIGV